MSYFNAGFVSLLANKNWNSIYINNTPCKDTTSANLSVYSKEVQDIEISGVVQFPVVEIKNEIDFDAATGKVTIKHDGDYSIFFFVNSNSAGQLTIFKNGTALPPAGTFPVSGGGLYSLKKGDVLEIKNTGTSPITTAITTGSEASAPTKLIINKLN